MTEPALDPTRPAGIEGFPGPFAVGRYARELQAKLRSLARVCLIGEVTGFRNGRGANVYFELRDAEGAVPCAMWRSDFDKLDMELRDGIQVVAAGGTDYYPGGGQASPSFSFRVSDLRPAGEGDLLARLERLRRQLAEEGLFEPQKRLARPVLPRTIGVVAGQGSAAYRDLVVALERRGWRGRLVQAWAPVQDRRAAPAIAAALRDLAATQAVEAIVVTRGGGSIADLWAFCDETLCRTVALLPVPVISAVGHEVDRTLIDDVAAVCCSTPTHAAEEAVRVDCTAERRRMLTAAAALDQRGRAAVLARARALAALSRAPREHVRRNRQRLHQEAKELRAVSRRRLSERLERLHRIPATVVARKRAAALVTAERERERTAAAAARLERAARLLTARRAQALEAQATALRSADPDRVLERGYAIVEGCDGAPLQSAAAITDEFEFDVRMADGTVPARVRREEDR